MPSPTLTVEVTATVKVRQTVNAVELFQAMDERDQKRYRDLDIDELGMDSEWQRPLAYLWPEDDDLVPLDLVRGGRTPVWGDIPDVDVRVAQRAEERVYGREGEWTEADFQALASQVPWLRRFHDLLDNPPSDEALARVPGPDDQPLF